MDLWTTAEGYSGGLYRRDVEWQFVPDSVNWIDVRLYKVRTKVISFCLQHLPPSPCWRYIMPQQCIVV